MTDTTNALRALDYPGMADTLRRLASRRLLQKTEAQQLLDAANMLVKLGHAVDAALATAQPDTPREPAEDAEDEFCDANCVWTDHHPDCIRAQPDAAAVGKREAGDVERAAYIAGYTQGAHDHWSNNTEPDADDLRADAEAMADHDGYAAHPKQGGGAEGSHKAGDHTSEAGR